MRKLDADRVLADVARRIAELREERNWTQAELAERADVSLKYLQRIESGSSNPTLRTLVKFANALRVQVAPLFEAPRSRRRRKPGRPRKS